MDLCDSNSRGYTNLQSFDKTQRQSYEVTRIQLIEIQLIEITPVIVSIRKYIYNQTIFIEFTLKIFIFFIKFYYPLIIYVLNLNPYGNSLLYFIHTDFSKI